MDKTTRTIILIKIATIGVDNFNMLYGTDYKSYEDAFNKTKEELSHDEDI